MSGSLLAGIVITEGTGSGGGGGVTTIPEYYTDPVSPVAEQAWVLATGSGAIADGTPMGLLLALTYTGNGGSGFTYQFSYRTIEGTTKRVTLS
jgi:hypothetical protein